MGKSFKGVIYKITNNINGKTYIGQTYRGSGFNGRYPFRGEGIERVYHTLNEQKDRGVSYNPHLLRSIENYGFDSFSVDKEFDIAHSKEELNSKEIKWISYYDTTNYYKGYNNTAGGEGQLFDKNTYKKAMRNGEHTPIICITTGELFLTAREASNKLDISETSVRESAKDKRGGVGSHSHNYRYNFKYYNEDDPKPIILVNKDELFSTIYKASRATGVQCRSIKRCCQDSYKKHISSGKDPITSERLLWMYQLDYKLTDWNYRYKFVYRSRVTMLDENNEYVYEWFNKEDAAKDLSISKNRLLQICKSKNKRFGQYKLLYTEDYYDLLKKHGKQNNFVLN